MKVVKIILWVAIGLSLLSLSFLMLINRIFFFGASVGLVGFWAFMSIKIIGPAEMAVFILLGEPIGFRESGPCFVLWLFAKLERYPKKMYNLNYPARDVITKKDEYPKGSGIEYGKQVLRVDATAYLNFPRELGEDPTIGREEKTHPLIKILRAEVPTKDEELKDWTEEAVEGALRSAFGKITWVEATESLEKLTADTEKVFTADDGVLIKAGFRKPGIRLVIEEIHLPDKLKATLPQPDQTRLEADAAKYVANRRAIETVGAVVEMFHQLTGMPITEIKTSLKETPREFIERHREAWEKSWEVVYREMAIEGGALVDIRFIGAEGLEKAALDVLAAWLRMP